jgi:hypothetical protein
MMIDAESESIWQSHYVLVPLESRLEGEGIFFSESLAWSHSGECGGNLSYHLDFVSNDNSCLLYENMYVIDYMYVHLPLFETHCICSLLLLLQITTNLIT